MSPNTEPPPDILLCLHMSVITNNTPPSSISALALMNYLLVTSPITSITPTSTMLTLSNNPQISFAFPVL